VTIAVDSEVLARVLRRFLSPGLATTALQAIEEEAGKHRVDEVSEIDQAAAIQALKERGLR
jgi:hypothetical protein